MHAMNCNHLRTFISAAAIGAALTSFTSAAPLPGEETKARYVMTTAAGDDNHVIEVRIENGNVTIRRDCQEVPEAQIKREDGQIIILDENGNQIDSVNLAIADGHEGMFYKAGDGAAWAKGLAKLSEAGLDGPTPRVMIGIQTADPGPALQKHLHLEPGAAVMVGGIYEGLPAQAAGLEQYDIIVKVNGQPIAEGQGVTALLAESNPGDTVSFSVIQAGQPREFKVKLMEYDAQKLKESKLIGGMPSIAAWAIAGPEGAKNAQGFRFQEFVTPDYNLFEKLETSPEASDMYFRALQPMLQGTQPRQDLQQRLDQLDDRLDKLEELLNRLEQKKN
jgi:hypothetical protein